MSRISPWVVAPPMIFATIAAMFFFGLNRSDPNSLPSAMIGKQAPDLHVTPLGDLPPATEELIRTGAFKLVNFWASWCAPCRVEHPNLEQLAKEGLPIYGVNYKDNPQNALGFLEELGNPYAALGADEDGRMAIDWGVYGVPETYVIDGEGTILLRFAGPLTQRVIAETIRPALDLAQD